MSNKRFCGLINTPKTATNDEKHFFGSQNTPLFDIPTFNFQPTSEEQLSKQQSFAAKDVDFLKDGQRIHSRRNSVSDSEQLDDYSGAPLKLADPLEHRVKRRHHSGGSHLSEVSPRQPIVATVELKTDYDPDELIDSLESVAKSIDHNPTANGSLFPSKSLFDENDDDVNSVDFDHCIDNDETETIPDGTSVVEEKAKGKKTRGRVKINIELIKDKERRSTTFSKRKNGILKKARELAVLTGAQVMLLIASETGHVYSYATEKLRPIIQGSEGEQLVLSCLKTPKDAEKGMGSKPIKMEVIPCGSQQTNTETVNGNLNSFKPKLEDFSIPKNNRKRKLDELREMRNDANKSVPLPNSYQQILHQPVNDLVQHNFLAQSQQSSNSQHLSSNNNPQNSISIQQMNQNNLLLRSDQKQNSNNNAQQYTTILAPPQRVSSSTPQIFLTNQPTAISHHGLVRDSDHHIQTYPTAAGILDSSLLARNGTIQRTTEADSNIIQAFMNNSLLQPVSHNQQSGVTNIVMSSSQRHVAPQQRYIFAPSSSSELSAGAQTVVNLTSVPTVHAVHSNSGQFPRIKEEFQAQQQIVSYANSAVSGHPSLASSSVGGGGLISLRPVHIDPSVANLVSSHSHGATTVSIPATHLQVLNQSQPPRIRSVPPVSNSRDGRLSPTRT